MKPKEFLAQLREYAEQSSGEMKGFFEAKLDGAQEMYDLIRGAQYRYIDANRDKVRAYNTQYQRERRAKIKAMREDVDKIANIK